MLKYRRPSWLLAVVVVDATTTAGSTSGRTLSITVPGRAEVAKLDTFTTFSDWPKFTMRQRLAGNMIHDPAICGSTPLAARTLRGGRSIEGHRRPRRPLRRFLAPALVWLAAAMVDYDLWWNLGPIAAASSGDKNRPFGFVCGRLADTFAANRGHFVCFHVLLALALLSQIAVMVADPGFLTHEQMLLDRGQARESGRWCDRCEAFKPSRAHHCRRCGACVARMDHHCVFAANCVGAGNHKQFVLLLLCSTACAVHANLLYFRLTGFIRRGVTSVASIELESTLFPKHFADAQGAAAAAAAAASSVLSAHRGLLSAVPLVVVLAWLVVILVDHLYGIAIHAGTVDRMQAASINRRTKDQVVVLGGEVWPVSDGVSSFSEKSQGSGFVRQDDAPVVGDAAERYPSPYTHRSAGSEVSWRVANLPRGPKDTDAAAVSDIRGAGSEAF